MSQSKNPKFFECVGATVTVAVTLLAIVSIMGTNQAKAGDDGDHNVVHVQVEAPHAAERQAALEEIAAGDIPPPPAPEQGMAAAEEAAPPRTSVSGGVGTSGSGEPMLTTGPSHDAEMNLKLLEDQVLRNKAAYEDEKKRLEVAKAGLAELRQTPEPDDEMGKEIRATSISMKREEVASLQTIVDKMKVSISREDRMRGRLGKDYTKKYELLRTSEENIRTWASLVLGRSSVTD